MFRSQHPRWRSIVVNLARFASASSIRRLYAGRDWTGTPSITAHRSCLPPPADPTDFHRTVEAASGRPVLARGGGRMQEEAVFLRTRELMQQGARGIVYGRNIIQHPRPRQMTRAFMSIVHHDAGVEQAMAILNS